MKSITVKSYALWHLRSVFESGIFAVPKLQREFVWSPSKACDLLDSIYHNYPIGNALVWKTDQRKAPLLRTEMRNLPPYNHSNREVYFLIDGQQRLSVLWQVLREQADRIKNAGGQEIDFGRLYFNAEAGDEEELFVYRMRRPSDSHVPVVDFLATKWRSRLPSTKRPRSLRRHQNRLPPHQPARAERPVAIATGRRSPSPPDGRRATAERPQPC